MRVEDAGSSFFTSVIECFAPCKPTSTKNDNGILSGGKYQGDWDKRYRGSAIGSIQDAIARGERPGGYSADSGTVKFGSKKKPLDKKYAAPLEVNPFDDQDPHVRAARAEQIRVNLERQMEAIRVAKEKGYSQEDAVKLSTGIRTGDLQGKQLTSLFRTTRTGSDKFASQILGVSDEISRVTRIGLIDEKIERHRQRMEDRKYESPAEEHRRKSRESMGSYSGSFNSSRPTSMDKSLHNSGSPAGSRPGSFSARRPSSSSMKNLFAGEGDATPKKERRPSSSSMKNLFAGEGDATPKKERRPSSSSMKNLFAGEGDATPKKERRPSSSSMKNLFAGEGDATPKKEHGSPASSRPTSGSFTARRSSTGAIP